jgi:transposase
MRSLSRDLRERIVRRYGGGKPAEEVAAHFEVSVRSVYRFVKLAREGQSLAPRKVGGSRSLLEREGLHEVIQRLVREDSEATLQVYVERLRQRTGVEMSTPSLCRALQQLGLTRKKRQSSPGSATSLRG